MITTKTWNSIPMVNLSANHIRDLGNVAKAMVYEDKLDPEQDECSDEYWNERYMERNAAITKVEIEKARPKWCHKDIWKIIIEFIKQPIIMKINQDMVNINAKSPVAITTMRSHKSILRSLTRINKEIRSNKRDKLQVFYDLLNTEWIATKPNPRKRDSPIIEIEANEVKAVYFWQLGGAIPAAEIVNDDKFRKNEEWIKSPAPFRLIAYLYIQTYGTTSKRDLMVQFQLNNFAASVNVGQSGLKGGGMFIYKQARTLQERRIKFREVLKNKGLHVHQAFFENPSGNHWTENQHTFLSAFHMIRFLSNPAQTDQIRLLMKRGTGGTVEMNEILKLNGDFGYHLPACNKHRGAYHLHFLNDKQCFGPIRCLNDYYKILYQHFLSENDTDGLNIVNSDCIKEFTNSLNDIKNDKIPENEYSRRLFDYFNIEAEPLRFGNWVRFLEFRDIKNVNFMGENRTDIMRKQKKLESPNWKEDSEWDSSDEEERKKIPPSVSRSRPKSFVRGDFNENREIHQKDESDNEDLDLEDQDKTELPSTQKANKDTLHQELSEDDNDLDKQRQNMIILSDDDYNVHDKNKNKRRRKRKLIDLTEQSGISLEKEIIDLEDNDDDAPSNTSSEYAKQPPKKKRRVQKSKCGDKKSKKHKDKEEV